MTWTPSLKWVQGSVLGSKGNCHDVDHIIIKYQLVYRNIELTPYSYCESRREKWFLYFLLFCCCLEQNNSFTWLINTFESVPNLQDVASKSHLSGDYFNSYLHENYVDFLSSVEDLERATQYLSDADYLSALWIVSLYVSKDRY